MEYELEYRLRSTAYTAERMDLSDEKVRQLAKSGRLRHVKIDHLYKFRDADIDAFLEDMTVGG